MSNSRKPAGLLAPQPVWLRGLAAFCLLLLAFVSTAQAAHIHSNWADHGKASAHRSTLASQSDDSEEHCQLCQAMHSALHAEGSMVPVASVELRVSTPELAVHSANSQWLFAMFSRPPPVLTTAALSF